MTKAGAPIELDDLLSAALEELGFDCLGNADPNNDVLATCETKPMRSTPKRSDEPYLIDDLLKAESAVERCWLACA